MTVMALLQARSSSTRLPGKVLKPLLGEPMILRQIERLRRARNIDRLMVVTSDSASDDELAARCVEAGVEVFRGSLDDVLDRFYSAVRDIRPQHVVRLTADCPLADPEVIDAVIDFYRDGDFDYASNVLEPTYPDGLDAEVFRFSVLETIWQEASLASQREHVTSFIYQHPERFRLGCLKRESDLSALRWTVDEPSDLEFVTAVYGALYRDNPAFLMADVLRLLAQRPELIEINAGQLRNAGYVKSLVQDELLPRRV
ncbi:cytidylyltransferase domain-containing protein [Cupriavidus sp. YAF13]|uniref:cytidylyltransferase domain-containing protein n=1 Tax=Cupriavidus sp. YAF13 TaxID=3233075 RepID=UPI003F8DA3C1